MKLNEQEMNEKSLAVVLSALQAQPKDFFLKFVIHNTNTSNRFSQTAPTHSVHQWLQIMVSTYTMYCLSNNNTE